MYHYPAFLSMCLIAIHTPSIPTIDMAKTCVVEGKLSTSLSNDKNICCTIIPHLLRYTDCIQKKRRIHIKPDDQQGTPYLILVLLM